MPDLDVVRLLTAKRDGARLSPEDVTALVAAYTSGDVPDYQMAAFLMAAFIRGLDESESAAYTRAMLHSGEVLDLSDLPGTKVDKHSTGGVGDKVSLLLAPLVAACGVPVPMISGRGLGHTGGTLDKLESIPGFRTDLDIDAYRRQLDEIGVVMIGQTAEIAPADKKLYALRDVTGTVESIPLIAASIMSKKLAEGIDALVLDVKAGKGAFMKSTTEARRLAEALVGIGEEFGKPTVALLTRMDAPLGRAVGNGPETAEAIRALHGDAPLGGEIDDMLEVTLALAGEMIALGNEASGADEGRRIAEAAVRDGFAWGVMREMVEAQGGDVAVMDDPSLLHGEPVATVEAPQAASAGFVTAIDAFEVGLAAVALGAGRARKEDDVDPKAGYVLLKKPGEAVEPGEPLAHIYASRPEQANPERLLAAFAFGESAPAPEPMILDRLDASGWRG
ncbi:thymidine phosphorylase [Rubricoccus marinus]|uniref:thymidine phosphorylase n=1 Tax=Rubricoccus marinus TaxID=716817 RepID=A0A259U1D4_9BACT|nr:thymidine phosphorylase [Rubricoccus marinus]OZC03835.1 thymidine phosphorylase [Rubricoccus marinus]